MQSRRWRNADDGKRAIRAAIWLFCVVGRNNAGQAEFR
jgi:hypothetical protein